MEELDPMRVRWFGTPWNPWFCTEESRVPVPTDETCAYCGEGFVPEDDGFRVLNGSTGQHDPYHYDCHMRQITGSLGHVMGWCSCHGGDPQNELDPEAMTKRQAASAAVRAWERTQRSSL